MSELTRRAFLKQSGVTAAAAGAAVAVPKGLTGRSQPEQAKRPARQTVSAAAAERQAERRLVVHVPDTGKSELHLLIGEREVVLRDRDLVNRLVRETH
jgi:hypothetical protein